MHSNRNKALNLSSRIQGKLGASDALTCKQLHRKIREEKRLKLGEKKDKTPKG